LKQSLADHILYLRSDGILMFIFLDYISMLYPEDATKAAIEVKGRLLEQYEIPNLGLACQFLSIEIHREEDGICTGTAICLRQNAFISTILKGFNIQNAHCASTRMDLNVKRDLSDNQGEKELKYIQGYRAIVSSLMYAALTTRPNISFAVAPLS
jgi:hypothetical protein